MLKLNICPSAQELFAKSSWSVPALPPAHADKIEIKTLCLYSRVNTEPCVFCVVVMVTIQMFCSTRCSFLCTIPRFCLGFTGIQDADNQQIIVGTSQVHSIQITLHQWVKLILKRECFVVLLVRLILDLQNNLS